MGRKQHQKNRRQPNCYRDGVKREIAEKRKVAFKHLNLWTKKKIPLQHASVFEKHGHKPFSADAKQICLNVYQTLRNEGLGVKEVFMMWEDLHYTVWKLKDFHVTQISREINFLPMKKLKNFCFHHFRASELCKFGKFQTFKKCKNL